MELIKTLESLVDLCRASIQEGAESVDALVGVCIAVVEEVCLDEDLYSPTISACPVKWGRE